MLTARCSLLVARRKAALQDGKIDACHHPSTSKVSQIPIFSPCITRNDEVEGKLTHRQPRVGFQPSCAGGGADQKLRAVQKRMKDTFTVQLIDVHLCCNFSGIFPGFVTKANSSLLTEVLPWRVIQCHRHPATNRSVKSLPFYPAARANDESNLHQLDLPGHAFLTYVDEEAIPLINVHFPCSFYHDPRVCRKS
jgi:hypothetical protein